MAKFRIYPTRFDYSVRRYVSNEVHGNSYFVDVNLKKNHFAIYYKPTKQMYVVYLNLNNNPKRVLENFGYCLDDFLDYDSVIGFLNAVIKHVKTNGNNIGASFSRYFIADFDLELL